MEMQLELNIEDKTPSEMQLHLMQKQIAEMNESMGKVRRRLFFELGSMKKDFADLAAENNKLRLQLNQMRNSPDEWIYGQEEYLFKIKEA